MNDDDRGAVTAELAVALPAVVVVIVLAVAALSAAGQGVRLEQAAAQAARLAARGESAADARTAALRLVPGATVTITPDGDLVCAAVTAEPTAVLRLPLPTQRATSCALAGGL